MATTIVQHDTVADTPIAAARRRLEGLLARVRLEQAAAVTLGGLLIGLSAALAVAAALLLVDMLAVLGPDVRRWLRWLPALVLIGGATAVFARRWSLLDPLRLALLLERRHPQLQHLLPTVLASDGRGALASLLARRADAQLDSLTTRGAVRWPAARSLLPTAIAAAVTALLLFVAPGGAAEALARWIQPSSAVAWSARGPLGVGGSEPGSAAPRFERIAIEIIPPAYTGLPATRPGEDESLTLLPGTGVHVRGPLPAGAHIVRARLTGAGEPPVRLADGEWLTDFTYAGSVRALVVEALAGDGTMLARRVLPLLLREDRAPVVELLEPERDLVLARPRGVIDVRARALDDFGIHEFELAWVRSRGSGESFQYEESVMPWARSDGTDRGRTGDVRVDLAALDLQPGDALHLRAIARDAPAAGGTGVSRTRVIRIARDGDVDEINTLIGFPLEGEEAPVLSQRMIIVMTEQLLARAAQLDPETLRDEAARIAHEQRRLRQRVGDQIYIRATGGIQGVDEEFGAEDVGAAPGHDHETNTAVLSDSVALTGEERAERERALLEAASRATGQGTREEIEHVHDESVILAVNRPLMEIYNAMWSAERELRLIEPRAALPHENRALDLLQALRAAERVYSRARQRAPPVDVAAARGTGRLTDVQPVVRSAAETLPLMPSLLQKVEALEHELPSLDASAAALALSAAAVDLLAAADPGPAAGALLARAADEAARGDRQAARELLADARRVLAPESAGAAAAVLPLSRRRSAGEYLRRRAAATRTEPVQVRAVRGGAPFTFATLRYESGNWDSAPLVPSNIAHAVAQYTDIDVAPEGIEVDLSSDDVFDHPFVFMTGHLPVRFSDGEARNLRAYVERGGLVFIDDHGHDIDGAFHRTVTAELDRVFGSGAVRELPNDHELYRTFFVFEDGPPATPHEMNGWGDGLIHDHLRAIDVGGRIGVLYSNKDYASEWNYHYPNKRFLGLDNTRFAVNIVLYALTR